MEDVHSWLERFGLGEFLRAHVVGVMERVPATVREDLLGDPCFVMCVCESGRGMEVPVSIPRSGGVSRSVAFKRSLERRPPGFVRYVIAHELAHAHLRNGGRWPGEDPEGAADALAEEWGFPRVAW